MCCTIISNAKINIFWSLNCTFLRILEYCAGLAVLLHHLIIDISTDWRLLIVRHCQGSGIRQYTVHIPLRLKSQRIVLYVRNKWYNAHEFTRKKNETNHETISHRFEIQQIPVESQTRQDLGGALDHTEDDEYRHIYTIYIVQRPQYILNGSFQFVLYLS